MTVWLKHIFKIAILIFGAVALEPFLTQIMILRLGPLLRPLLIQQLGRIGGNIWISIEIIIPLFLVGIIIGVLGGLWIGGKAINGFVTSLIFCIYWFTMTIIFYDITFDLITLLSLIGLLVVPVVGSLMYGIFSKRFRASTFTVPSVS